MPKYAQNMQKMSKYEPICKYRYTQKYISKYAKTPFLNFSSRGISARKTCICMFYATLNISITNF